MPTLELTLQRQTESGYPVVAALTRPGGFLPLRREGMLNLDVATLAELQYEPLAYGTTLGQALFVDEIRDAFREGLSGGEPLRVLLSIEAPDLRALDWHRLAAPFDGRWRCLASQQNTPFSLSVPSPASAHFPALGRRDLRALLLVAGPEALSGDYKLAPFDVSATLESIKTALGDIPCDILDNPSLDALCATLTATPYTLLHLVCHGAVNQNGETILYFPKDERRTPTPATDLLNRLSSLARLPHFAFISACESALPQNGLGSLAGRLVRELGLPAVLAMTDRVSIATASAIAAPFYAHLYQHGQPDLALAQSLAGLQGAHDLTVPAIFSRLGDRPLFDDNAERALSDNELEFGLAKLAEFLPERAPVMDGLREKLTLSLRSTLGVDFKALSESRRAERKESLDGLNSLSLEALDLSFNALCLGQTPPAYDSRSPFRGLESFRPEDAAYFFGRETLTKRLVQKLNEHNFLAVLGASGSGKSSLVMAGLIPALNVPYAVFRPGAEPLSELEKTLQAGPQLLVVDQFEELFTLSAREQRAGFISRLLEQSQRLRVVITLRADFLGEVAPFKSLKDEVQNHQEIIPPMDEAELRRAMEGQAGCAGLRFESDLSQQMLDDVSGEPGAMPLLQHALWMLWTRRHGRWLRAGEYRAFGGVKQAIASTAEAVFARCTEFEKERLRDIFLRLTRLDESADGRDTRRRVLLRDLIPADSEPESTKLPIKQLEDARLVIVNGDDIEKPCEVEVAHEALIRHWERLRTWLNDDRDNLRLLEGVSEAANAWNTNPKNLGLLLHSGERLIDVALRLRHVRLNEKEQGYIDACEQVGKMRRNLVFVALLIILVILVSWGLTSTISANKNAIQVAIAQTSQAEAEYAKATAVAEANIRATAQATAEFQKKEAQKQSQIVFARQLAAQAQLLYTGNNSKKIPALLLAILSMQIYPLAESSSMLQENTFMSPVLSRNHWGRITTVTFSPNSRYVAVGGYNETICIWDISTGVEIVRIKQNGLITSASFSPDSEFLATGSQFGDVYVWEANSGKQVIHVPADILANSDAPSQDKKISGLWISTVVFSPDGKYIISGGYDGIARVLDAYTGKEIARVQHDSWVNSLAISSDGLYVVSGSQDGITHVWESNTGKVIIPMTKNISVSSVAFSPNDMYVVSGVCSQSNFEQNQDCSHSTVFIWETFSGKQTAQSTLDYEVRFVTFSPNGKYIISSGISNFFSILDANTGQEIIRLGHSAQVTTVDFSPDDKYVISGSKDGTARIWDVNTGAEVAMIAYDNQVTSARFSSNNQYVAFGSENGILRVLKLDFMQKVNLGKLDNAVTSLSSVPNGDYIVSGSEDGSVQIWNASNGEDIFRMKHEGKVTSVSFSPDGKYVLSSSQDKTVRIWELSTGSEMLLIQHSTSVESAAFSLDGNLIVSGSEDGVVRILNSNNGQEITYMEQKNPGTEQNIPVNSVSFSPDGRYVASGGSNNHIYVWEVDTGKEILSKKLEFTFAEAVVTGVTSISISPNGNFIALGSKDGYARVLKLSTGEEIVRVKHNGVVNSVAFNPNGKYVVSGSQGGIAQVWNMYTGIVINLLAHTESVNAVAFTRDGQYVISGGADTNIYVWVWSPEKLLSGACLRAGRNLTKIEWNLYIGDALTDPEEEKSQKEKEKEKEYVICPNVLP